MSKNKNNKIKGQDDPAKIILNKCIKALRGEIDLNNLNVVNNIYEPLKSELKEGRYDDLTVEIYSQSAEIIQRKADNLLDFFVGDNKVNNFKFFKLIKDLSDEDLANTITFFHEIPEFPIPLTENYVLKCYTDLVINRPERKKYTKTVELIDYISIKRDVVLIDKEIDKLYKKIISLNKENINFKELLCKKTWKEASYVLILLGYLASKGKIDIMQKDFPNGDIIIILNK
ncbi:MAG: hypothetical protein ACTSYZ_08890 [Candidatus Helarchaeota archaeon]